MSSSDELDVSVDAISAGPTPGQKLRLAREKRGLTLDDVSAETNLSPKYLQALEVDDYAALPGLAFARGYARRYAQLVHLDGSALIAEMNVLAAEQGIAAPASLSASSPSMQRASLGISQVAARKASDVPSSLSNVMAGLQRVNMAQVLSFGSLLLLLLLLLGTLFWQGNSDTSIEPMADNEVIDIDAGIAQQIPPEAAPVVPDAVASMPVAAPPLNDSAPIAVAPAPASEPSALTVTPTPASVPAATVAPTSAASPVVSPAPVTPAQVAAPVPAKPLAAAPVVALAAKPAPAPAVPPGIDSLNFGFTGKSWISVRDATGQELVYGLKNTGQTVTVTGQAPFSINIGNVNVTSLSRNGRAVNLKQYARGEIASFRLAPALAPSPKP